LARGRRIRSRNFTQSWASALGLGTITGARRDGFGWRRGRDAVKRFLAIAPSCVIQGYQSKCPQEGQVASRQGNDEGSIHDLVPQIGQRFASPSGVREEMTADMGCVLVRKHIDARANPARARSYP
jgi:hypothetical protein